jgi:hypothetical protein
MASDYAYQYSTDRSLYIFKWPTWNIANSFSYTFDDATKVFGFDMSLKGNTLSRTLETWGGSWSYQSLVTDRSGSTSIWADTAGPMVPLLSPDGTHFAVTDSGPRIPGASTRLYSGGTLSNVVMGCVVGWLDDGHLLLQTFSYGPGSLGPIVYSGSVICDPLGNVLSSPPLPEIASFDAISPTVVFSHTDQKLYDMTTGAVISSTGLGPHSVAAGPFIVSLVGHSLVARRY